MNCHFPLGTARKKEKRYNYCGTTHLMNYQLKLSSRLLKMGL